MFNMKKILSVLAISILCLNNFSTVYANFDIPSKYYIADELDIIDSTDEDYYESLGKQLSKHNIDFVLLHKKEEVATAAEDMENIYYTYLNNMSIGQQLVLIVFFEETQTLLIKDESGNLKESDKNKLQNNFAKYLSDNRKADGLDYLFKAGINSIVQKNKIEGVSDINNIHVPNEYEKDKLISPQFIILVLIILTLGFGLRRRKE